MKKFTEKQLIAMEQDIYSVCEKMRRLYVKYKISQRLNEGNLDYAEWAEDGHEAIVQRFNDIDGFLDDFWSMIHNENNK